MLNPPGKRTDPYRQLLRFVLITSLLSVCAWSLTRYLGRGGLGRYTATMIFLALAGTALWALARRRRVDCCCALAYLAAVEPAVRGYGRHLPYLALEYLLILVAVGVVLQRTAPLRYPTFFLGLYLALELSGLMVAANAEDGRWMAVMTAGRLAFFLIIQRAGLTSEQAVRVVATYTAGALAMAAMALQGAVGMEASWSTQSNSMASGGFGPNQVAGLLVLGAFGAIFLADVDPRPIGRFVYLVLAGTMVLAALLTFTRGGSFILILGLMFYAAVLGLSGRLSGALLGAALVLPVVALFAFDFTDQMLLERYQQRSMSHREDIWVLGLRIFWENPLLGVGTGNFYEASQGRLLSYQGRVGSHNELIRALSEHGIVGACIWTTFVGACLAACWRQSGGLARAASVSWVVMAVAFECHSGLKLAMSAFFIALAVEGFRKRGDAAHPLPRHASVRRCIAVPRPVRAQWV